MRILVLLSIILLSASCRERTSADLIVHHGKIYTVDSAFSITEAFAAKDGKIIETGANDYIRNKYLANTVIDAGGNTVYPGFIDAHAHFLGYARMLFEADLTNTHSWPDVADSVKAFADRHPGEP